MVEAAVLVLVLNRWGFGYNRNGSPVCQSVCAITRSSNCLGSILSSVIELLGYKVVGHRTSDARSWALGHTIDMCRCVPVCICNQTQRSHKRGSRWISLHIHLQAHYIFNRWRAVCSVRLPCRCVISLSHRTARVLSLSHRTIYRTSWVQG